MAPTNAANVGWRNVTPLATITPPRITLTTSGQDILLGWPSDLALEYLPQRSTNLLVWSNLTVGYLPGTGANQTHRDLAPGRATPAAFYRLLSRYR
jgi:hypothetical protein